MYIAIYVHLYLHALTLYYYRCQPKIDSETLYPQVLAVIILVVAAVGIEVIGNNDNLQFCKKQFLYVVVIMCASACLHIRSLSKY